MADSRPLAEVMASCHAKLQPVFAACRERDRADVEREAALQRERRQRELNDMLPTKLRLAHIREVLRGLSEDTYIRKARPPYSVFDLEHWLAGPSGLFLSGSAGVGKSYALAAVARALSEAGGMRVAWYTLGRLVLRIMDAPLGQKEETLVRGLRYDAVVINEIGVTQASDGKLEVIQLIFDELESNGRLPLLASNLEYQALAELYGDRVTSRMVGMCERYEVRGPDRRKEQRASRP